MADDIASRGEQEFVSATPLKQEILRIEVFHGVSFSISVSSRLCTVFLLIALHAHALAHFVSPEYTPVLGSDPQSTYRNDQGDKRSPLTPPQFPPSPHQ
ncbi:MAG: hypothetical protein F6K30_19105 [Cyanothece sp. SIO2G6]|nr:hypothetical protein [Cyanothece sp. SIO2G6]